MLKFRTPNGEVAGAGKWMPAAGGGRVISVATSTDFEGDVEIGCLYQTPSDKEYDIDLLLSAPFINDGALVLVDKLSNERFGMLIPISALSSTSHDRAGDDFFQLIASTVFLKLLDGRFEPHVIPDWKESGQYEISDFFIEGICVWAVRKGCLAEFGQAVNMDSYLPSLLSYGYSLYSSDEVSRCSYLSAYKRDRLRNLNLVRVASDLSGYTYVVNLYRTVLPFESSPVAFFVLVYQIIEALMHDVFKRALSDFKTYVGSFDSTVSELRELSGKLSGVTSEGQRIKEVWDGLNLIVSKALKDNCELLLRESGRANKDGIADLIYGVRNLIFHDYRAIPPAALSIVNDINCGLVGLMPSVLSKRRHSTTATEEQ